jgi:predicted ribosome quality control (RQC) complex YloA/Tae2 family protein
MKFREFITSSGKKVIGGKSAENNEELIEQILPGEYVLHTVKPGSPFVNIKADERETTKEDLKEAAIFCARYSQDWRDNKKDVLVHVFKGRDIYKEKSMKLGTFGVKNFKEIKVKKEDITNDEKKHS